MINGINYDLVWLSNEEFNNLDNNPLSTQTNRQVFSLRGFSTGTYLFHLLLDGSPIKIQKVVVLH